MTAARAFWIAWCVSWAVFWWAIGLATFGVGWFGTAASLLAATLPVGAPVRPPVMVVHHVHHPHYVRARHAQWVVTR